MKVVYDIETFKNCFTYTDINYDTKEYHQFVIHQSKNELEQFIQYLSQPGLQMIGFNNVHFDYSILHYLLTNYHRLKLMEVNRVTEILYNKAQEIIKVEKYYGIPESEVLIPQLDLFLIHHWNNLNRHISLKDVEFALQMDNIEEMPLKHDDLVKEQDIEKVLNYNKNDVIATELLLDVTLGRTEIPMYKGKDKIQLRKDVKNTFGINCLNYNDVKIGESIMKKGFLQNSNLRYEDLKRLNYKHQPFKFGDCFPLYLYFETKELQEFAIKVANTEVSIEGEKQIFKLLFRNTRYTIAKGGIHSDDEPRLIKPNDNQILRDSDIGSQYPNAFRKRKLYPRHLGEAWLIEYTSTIEKRLNAKAEYKKTGDSKFNSIQETYKLALNGSFGKTNEAFSWMYDPFVHFNCTIGNQFEILMLIEKMELNGIHVASANTDGIVCLFDKEKNELHQQICEEWEKQVGNFEMGKLEHSDYKLLAQTSVNDYIAIYDNGKIKVKGDFEIDKEFHKDPSMRIIRIALKEYFVNNVPISQTIRNHTNIKDFCLRLKINKSTLGLYNYIEDSKQKSMQLNRTTRYYVSVNGGSLVVYYNNSKSPTRINKGYNARICNKMMYYENMAEYKINYTFYEKECMKIISVIERTQQILNFDD